MRKTRQYSQLLAQFAVGDRGVSESEALRIADAFHLCNEFKGIIKITNEFSSKEDGKMAIEAAAISQLIGIIDDVIDKSRKDALKEQVLDFATHYMFVLRHGFRNGGTKECKAKEQEVFDHWQRALAAARSGDANALQNAISSALDDLQELAACLGIDPVPF